MIAGSIVVSAVLVLLFACMYPTAQRKADRDRTMWRNGFDYAAGQLLRGASVKAVMGLVECVGGMDDGPFEAGARRAIEKWKESCGE